MRDAGVALGALVCWTLGGCAIAHERATSDAGPRREMVCRDRGAITDCVGCGHAGCCLHFCQPDGTWSECSYVENACGDASVLSGSAGGDV